MPKAIETLEEALEVITGLRTENASYRTRATTAESQVTDLTTQIEGLNTQVTEQAATIAERDGDISRVGFERTRDRLALERGLPLDVAAMINASDEETLTTSLDALAALRGNPGEITPAPRPTDPAQVATPAHDPQAQALADAEAFFSN